MPSRNKHADLPLDPLRPAGRSPWRIAVAGLQALVLCGCASVVGPPPEYLLLDCPAPAVVAATNGDLARTLNQYRWALKACNDDKAALREFVKEP
jgi:hypothetical protein